MGFKRSLLICLLLYIPKRMHQCEIPYLSPTSRMFEELVKSITTPHKHSTIAHSFKFNICFGNRSEIVSEFVAYFRCLAEQYEYDAILHEMIRDGFATWNFS